MGHAIPCVHASSPRKAVTMAIAKYQEESMYTEEDSEFFSNEAYNELDDLDDYYDAEEDYYEEEDYYDFPENWEEFDNYEDRP